MFQAGQGFLEEAKALDFLVQKVTKLGFLLSHLDLKVPLLVPSKYLQAVFKLILVPEVGGQREVVLLPLVAKGVQSLLQTLNLSQGDNEEFFEK